ncbi:hypothetical protein SAMN02990966_00573 [Rhodospirillales bacterium URHD0017]|nr:hypothetical protein SAMN02990966_00573 [Rhodospirillales bacterium URHD0017]
MAVFASSITSISISTLMLLSSARGRGWERGLHPSIPPLLTSPPGGGEEHERHENERAWRPAVQ